MILFVHRKDLRIEDLHAFDYIAKQATSSLHVLILDPIILKKNRHLEHSGINFLRHAALLRREYELRNCRLHILYGEPASIIEEICGHHSITEIVFHADFTPYAMRRDKDIHTLASMRNIKITALQEGTLANFSLIDQLAGRKEPFKVFTPFYRRWSESLGHGIVDESVTCVSDLQTADLSDVIRERFPVPFELPESIADSYDAIGEQFRHFLDHRLEGYIQTRDAYAMEDGTSGVSRHINTGALSVRRIHAMLQASPQAEMWKRQLAWREFYMYQAIRNPHFFTYERQFDLSALSDRYFQAWAQGQTGIPIIDAAMRQLNLTGMMPNRLRMVTAMFLTKNLLCPFTLGEIWFRYKLTDYDNALNRGGWLWSASLGFDAAPYFRIMNPVSQSIRFDPEGHYIRRWLPELAHLNNRDIHQPQPHAIVDLKASRAQAIEIYKQIIASQSPEPVA